MLLLSRSDVKSAVTMQDAIEAAEAALAAYSAGRARIPIRVSVQAPEGITLFMPGLIAEGGALGLKVVSVFARNPERGLPTITALMVLNDVETGEPIAAMEAGYLTALRTGAASGVATRYLARSDADTVTVIGAGVQARTQLQAVLAVRPCKRAFVFDVSRAAAEGFAREMSGALGVDIAAVRDVNAAVAQSDIVITATTSRTPVFDGRSLKQGTHVNAVGAYTPEMQELDATTVCRADRFVADSREAVWKEAGDLIIPLRNGLIDENRVDAEVGDLALGRAPGRTDPNQITIYKGVGLAALDLGAAKLVYDRAIARNIGTKIDLLS